MDDTQNNGMNAQQATDSTQQPIGMPPSPSADMNNLQQVASMGDGSGMTPPPAPMQSVGTMPEPAPVQVDQAPMMTTDPMQTVSSPMAADLQQNMGNTMQTGGMNQSPTSPMGAMPDGNTGSMTMPPSSATGNHAAEADDYAYAEDLLDEILDSLDRIESKLEAIEKKMGQ